MSFYEVDTNNNKYYLIPETLLLEFKMNTTKNSKTGVLYRRTSLQNENMIYLKEDDYIEYSKSMMRSQNNDMSLNAITMAIESSFLMLEKEGVNIGSFTILENLSSQFLKLSFNASLKSQFKTVLASPRSKEFIMKAILCKTIANKRKWRSDKLLKSLFIASFFCDVGEIIPNPLNKTHQQLSIDFLKEYGRLSEDIEQAILHHHEYNDGSGPYKVKKANIHPIASIIRVVDEMLMLIMNKDKNFLKTIREMSILKLDSTSVKALLEIVKIG